MRSSETLTRAMVALVAIPIVIGAVYLGGRVLGAFLAVFAALGAIEVCRMAQNRSVRPFIYLGAAAAMALVLHRTAETVGHQTGFTSWGIIVASTLAALVAAIWLRGADGGPLAASGTTVFAALYTGGLMMYALELRHFPGATTAWHGTALVFAPVLLTWTSDTAAYFSGRALGRRKLIPSVSPGKTVEGAIGALVGTALVAVLYTGVLAHYDTFQFGLGWALVLGILISVAAQVGDLVESLLKRDTGVKDSGALFPGHGGVLDRVDSLLFTLPLAYLFFLAVAAR
jgi:phosphatidate cytidylyltransferase